MIDLKNFNPENLMKGLGQAAKEAENLLNGIDIDQAKGFMTPEQIKEFDKAKTQISEVNSKDLSKMNSLFNSFKK